MPEGRVGLVSKRAVADHRPMAGRPGGAGAAPTLGPGVECGVLGSAGHFHAGIRGKQVKRIDTTASEVAAF